MKHEHWIIESANLLVEKYKGVINKEDIGKGEGKLYRMMDHDRPFKSIVDVSEAIFFNIKHDEIRFIFDDFRNRLGSHGKGQFVLYNGNNAKDDYLKTSLFTKYETDNIQLRNFIDIAEASEWLGLSKPESLQVFKILNDH